MRTHFDVPNVPTVDRTAFLLERCRSKRTLHLGCTDWPLTAERFGRHELLHQKLKQAGCDVVGLDMDANGVKFFLENGLGPCVEGNVESITLADLGNQPFDVVLAGEIIEHLENPGLFLRACHPLLAPGGRLIITTINAYCSFRIGRYLFGREIVHEDHNYYFSYRTLERLVTRCGYHPVSFHFHGTGREEWRIPPHYRFAAHLTRLLLPRFADGIILEAKSGAAQ